MYDLTTLAFCFKLKVIFYINNMYEHCAGATVVVDFFVSFGFVLLVVIWFSFNTYR